MELVKVNFEKPVQPKVKNVEITLSKEELKLIYDICYYCITGSTTDSRRKISDGIINSISANPELSELVRGASNDFNIRTDRIHFKSKS